MSIGASTWYAWVLFGPFLGCEWSESRSVVSDSLRPHGILQARILEWVAFPFSRGIFPTQGSNPRLPHCKQILHCQNHRGSPMTNRVVSNPSIPPPPPTHTHPTPHHIKLQRLAHGWTIFPSQSDQSLEILLNAEEVDTYHWNCWMCHWVRPRETSGQFCYHLRKKFPSY